MRFDRSKPLWPQLADRLRARLDAGEWKPGEQLTGTVDLAAQYGVSQATAAKAVAALRREGRVHTILGSGTFVGPESER
ncbi:GntR family transcriptional regulator [Streptomyces sp. NPDC001312]|uniref:GntR family transcriptional regulator n=1 Tax=Streptomyces sp. NPDC001312 TaxID=3364561 RepID=UPI00369B3428